MKITGNEPANTVVTKEKDNYGGEYDHLNTGLTIRQYFAAMAMQSMIKLDGGFDFNSIARTSIAMADELIRQLNEKLNPNG